MDYVYEQLLSTEHIRILELEPSQDAGAPLRCQIIQRHLDDASPSFDAISYTWGGQARDRTLQISSCTLLITANLESALRRFRSKTQLKHLWADAVCINQADDVEKSKQIPHMATIFKGALAVKAWLGDDPDTSCALGIKCLTYVAKSSAARPEEWYISSDPIERAKWLVMAKVLDLPWFSRRWVIQELVLNTDATLYCGSSKISWPTLRLAVRRLIEANIPIASSATRLNAIDTLGDLSLTLANRGISNHSILELLEIFDHYGCEDPRDRIFALLGLASDIDEPVGPFSKAAMVVVPDYAVDWKQVYCQFMRAVVKRDGVLSSLLRVAMRCCGNDNAELPSWVPDFQRPPQHIHQYFSDLYYDATVRVNVSHIVKGSEIMSITMTAYTFQPPDASLARWDGLRVSTVLLRPFDIESDVDLATALRRVVAWLQEQLQINESLDHRSPLILNMFGMLGNLIGPLIGKNQSESNSLSPYSSGLGASCGSDNGSIDMAYEHSEDDFIDRPRSGSVGGSETESAKPSLATSTACVSCDLFCRALQEMIQAPGTSFHEACSAALFNVDPSHRESLRNVSFYITKESCFVDSASANAPYDRTRGQLFGCIVGEPKHGDIVLVSYNPKHHSLRPPVLLLRESGERYQLLGCSRYDCAEPSSPWYLQYATSETFGDLELDIV